MTSSMEIVESVAGGIARFSTRFSHGSASLGLVAILSIRSLHLGHLDFAYNDAGVCAMTVTATGVIWDRMSRFKLNPFGGSVQVEPPIELLYSKPNWVYCTPVFPANYPPFPSCPSAPPDFSLPPRPSPPIPSPSSGPLRDCYTRRRTELGNRASSGVLGELGLVDNGDIKNGAAAQHLAQIGMRPPTTRIRMRSPTFSLSLSLSFSLLCLFVSLSKNPTLSLLYLFVSLLRAPASSMRHPVTVGDVEGGLLPVLVLVDGLGVERGFGWSVAAGRSGGGESCSLSLPHLREIGS
ncbi:hypothetical protein TIFTF001_004197 [Ficus carica]|uniref:Uncharacterized protein n=1 Tax=Ficus carica TaxID=3494 RepID=A0AA87ZUG3_FICCA|nr:hypothetical protein TIFTF001_004197 [Ficus carica]